MLWYACKEAEKKMPCDPKDETECRWYGAEDRCGYRDGKPEGIATEMIDCIIRILDWCGKENLDVDKLLELKHVYNKTRPYRHGGKAL